MYGYPCARRAFSFAILMMRGAITHQAAAR